MSTTLLRPHIPLTRYPTIAAKTGTLLLLATGLFSGAHADQVSAIKTKGELVCGISGTSEPFSFPDHNTREMTGYDVELCKAIANKLGVKLTLRPLAAAERVPNLQDGKVDILAATLAHTQEREARVDFSLSTFLSAHKVLVKKDAKITDLKGLHGQKIAAIKSPVYESEIHKAIPDSQVNGFDSGKQALMSLLMGTSVGYANEESSLVIDLDGLGPGKKDFVILPDPIAIEHLALGIKKGEPEMKTLVNDTLRELESSGQAEKLFMKWFGPESKIKMSKRAFKIESEKIAP